MCSERSKMSVIVNVEQETGDLEDYGKRILDWLDSEPRKYGTRMIVPGGSIEFSFTPDGRTVSAETRSAEIRGFYERIEKEKELKDKWEKAAIHKAQENANLRSKLDEAIYVLKHTGHNVNHYKHGECLGCIAEGLINRLEQK